jgi:hypothetical protein
VQFCTANSKALQFPFYARGANAAATQRAYAADWRHYTA